MIKHVVIWKLLENAEGETKKQNAEKIKAMLEALPAKIKEIMSIEVGINTNPKEAYDVILVSEFRDLAALERYDKHPEHLLVGEFIAKVKESRACVDYFQFSDF